MVTALSDARPIAVFDSGLGGLTVVRSIRRRLPGESILYFGDTARVPYGIKSSPTVTRFAVEIVRFLLPLDPKAVVVACNTASAVAMPALSARFDLPIWDVIEPGARAAARAARRGPVGLLATEATVASEAYPRAIRRVCPDAEVHCQAAPLLVPLAEEGRAADDPIVRLAVRGYLAPLLDGDGRGGRRLAAVLLGCTHYPLLAGAIRAELGDGIELIDSAEQAAGVLGEQLAARGLEAAPGAGPGSAGGAGERRPAGTLTCLVSDNAERFARIGSRFLGEPIEQVRYVGPDEFFAAQAGAGTSAGSDR